MRNFIIFGLILLFLPLNIYCCMPTPPIDETPAIPIPRGAPGISPGTPGTNSGLCPACPTALPTTEYNNCAAPTSSSCDANNMIIFRCTGGCIAFADFQLGGYTDFTQTVSIRCDAGTYRAPDNGVPVVISCDI